MKKIISCVLISFALCAGPAISFSADSDMWVAITVFDGRNIGSVPEYYGKLPQSTFQKLTAELQEKRMFKLGSVFWINDEGKAVYMSDTKKHGRVYGYTNEVLFRADHIYRIILVDEKFIKALLQK